MFSRVGGRERGKKGAGGNLCHVPKQFLSSQFSDSPDATHYTFCPLVSFIPLSHSSHLGNFIYIYITILLLLFVRSSLSLFLIFFPLSQCAIHSFILITINIHNQVEQSLSDGILHRDLHFVDAINIVGLT